MRYLFRQLALSLLNSFGASALLPSRARTILLRLCGVRVNLRSRVSPGLILRTNKLELGRRTTLNYRCVIDNRAPVSIGDSVGIGVGVQLITSTHDYSDPKCRAGAGAILPIVIGNGVWIGSGAVVLAGVTIGEGAVIAAGSVVTRDCAPHGLYGGTPARRIKELDH